MKRSLFPLAATLAASTLAATLAAPVLAQPAAAAAEPVAPPAGRSRPKVCLVLSGGGARGAAHVGVIKVLEEYRVPIDCIVGTSMGSLVGGAYATGMSVAEMEQVNASITVERLFKEKPPREELAMRRKIDDYQNYLGLEFGTASGKATVGKGVVTGVQLETVLRSLARVQGYHRFDDLPIPYRAVATDLVTGKEVVFSDGELANVMRASMSVPGAVAPAEYRGMILVDGMLTSNLPVQAARAMGADVVIAVNVGTPLLRREELRSIVGVAGQMLSILTEQNVQASLALLKPTDILISPELGDFSTGDFDNLPKISPLGEAAARKVADRLAELSLTPEAYAALRRRQQIAMPTDLQPVDEIRFDGLSHVNPEVAKGIMQTQVGQPVAQADIDGDMRRLYGTGDFEHVDYRISEQDGRRVLTVEAVEKAWGPNYMRLGVGLSSDFSGETLFTLLGSHRMTWLNSLGAELRTDVQLGYDSQVRVEYYQPFDVKGRYFVAPRVLLGEQRINVYQGNDRVAVIQRGQSQLGVDLGVQFAQYGELRLGVEGGSIKPRLDTGPPVVEAGETNYDQGAYRLGLILDRLGSVDFPRSGWSAVTQVAKSTRQLGADADYTRWRASGSYVHSFGENTVRLSADAGGKIGTDPLPYYDLFQWGGFLRQSGYATGQLIGGDLKYGQLSYYRRIAHGFLVEGAYGGVALELGKVSKPLVPGNPDGLMKSIAFFVGADSIVGPVYLGYGRASDGASSLYFYLGNPY